MDYVACAFHVQFSRLLGFSKEIASVGYIQLAHVVIEAEKSQDVQFASWRPGEVMV